MNNRKRSSARSKRSVLGRLKRTLRNLLASSLTLLVGLGPSAALADNLRYKMQCEDPADRSTCVQPLETGERAPFAGQLLTHEAAAELVLAIETSSTTMQLELEHAARTASITRQADRKTAAIDLVFWQKRALRAEDRLANPPLLERPVIVAGLATAGTVVVVLLAIAALNAAAGQ